MNREKTSGGNKSNVRLTQEKSMYYMKLIYYFEFSIDYFNVNLECYSMRRLEKIINHDTYKEETDSW